MSFLNELMNINFKSQKQQDKEKCQSMVTGIIVGTAIGTIAGMFMQTDKCKVARKEVAEKAKDISQKSKLTLCESVKKVKVVKDNFLDGVMKKQNEKEYEEENKVEYDEENKIENEKENSEEYDEDNVKN